MCLTTHCFSAATRAAPTTTLSTHRGVTSGQLSGKSHDDPEYMSGGNLNFGFKALLGGFLGSFFLMALYTMRLSGQTQQNIDKKTNDEMSENQVEMTRRHNDPRRPPWPVLHKRVTEIREGTHSTDDLNLSWEQCKYYYPHDWLIPMELSQILQYSSAVFLKQYVPDPEQMRIDIINQLKMIRTGKMMTGTYEVLHLNRNTEEIIDSAILDLQKMDFRDTSASQAPLVPVYTK